MPPPSPIQSKAPSACSLHLTSGPAAVCVFELHFYTFTADLFSTKRDPPSSENSQERKTGKIESLTFSPKQITRATGNRLNSSRMRQMKIEGGKKKRKKKLGQEDRPFLPKTLWEKFSNLARWRKRAGGGAFQAPSANFRPVQPRTAILSRDHFSPRSPPEV